MKKEGSNEVLFYFNVRSIYWRWDSYRDDDSFTWFIHKIYM